MANIRKSMRRLLWRGYTQGEARLHELKYLFWETTLRCNLACRHCGSRCDPKSALSDELSTEEVKQAFDTIAEDYDPKKIAVAVTGGEPLMRKDVFDVAMHFARLGFRWGMVTNGMLINDRVVELMGATGMGSIAVSLDGFKEEHEFLRGPNTFRPTEEGLKKLIKAGILEINEVVTCPTSKLLPRLDEFYSYLTDLGVTQWRIITLMPIGRVKDHPELLLNGQQLRELFAWIRDKRRDGNAPLPVTLDEEGFLGEPWEMEVRKLPYFCFAGIYAGSILANGDVSGCPSINRSFVQGNVRDRRFSDIWDNEFGVFRDRRWMKTGDCVGCRSFGDCRGNSLHLWDSVESTGPNVCHLQLLSDKAEDQR